MDLVQLAGSHVREDEVLNLRDREGFLRLDSATDPIDHEYIPALMVLSCGRVAALVCWPLARENVALDLLSNGVQRREKQVGENADT